MAIRTPRYTHDEFARRGQEIYDRPIKLKLNADDAEQFVAIALATDGALARMGLLVGFDLQVRVVAGGMALITATQ